MTVRELIEKTPNAVQINDHGNKCDITPWSIFYDAFKNCVVDTINATDAGIEITLKTTLVTEAQR